MYLATLLVARCSSVAAGKTSGAGSPELHHDNTLPNGVKDKNQESNCAATPRGHITP